MKPVTLICGLIGALIGAGVWYFLETGDPPREANWAALLVGGLAGLGARLAAKASRLAALRGAVIAAIALATMYGTREAITYGLQKQGERIVTNFDPLNIGHADVEDIGTDDGTDDEASDTSTADTANGGVPIVPSDPASENPDLLTELALREAAESADIINSANQMMEAGRPNAATPAPAKPPLIDASMLVYGFYIVGTLLAYLIGKGPSIKRSANTASEAPATS